MCALKCVKVLDYRVLVIKIIFIKSGYKTGENKSCLKVVITMLK